MSNRILIVIPLAALIAFAACAQAGPAIDGEVSALVGDDDAALPPPCPGGPGSGHGPPQAALDACQGKAAGDACSVALPDREIAGSCVAPPEDAPPADLFCVPADAPRPAGGPRGHRGPPPEAFAACEGVPVGDACTVPRGDDAIEGHCLTPPWDDEAPAACVPEGAPRGPRE